MAGEEQPGNDDDAELGDGQKERSKRSQGHSALIVGLTSAAVTPRKRDSLRLAWMSFVTVSACPGRRELFQPEIRQVRRFRGRSHHPAG